MKIIKFYNEIIRSAPLLVSNGDITKYIKQQRNFEDLITKFETPQEPIYEELETHDLAATTREQVDQNLIYQKIRRPVSMFTSSRR